MGEKNNVNLVYLPSPDNYRTDAGFSEHEQTVLDHVNQKIAAGNSLEEIIDFLFSNTQSIFPCDRIGVAFIEENGKRMRLYFAKANYSPLYLEQGYAADIQGSSLKTVFQSLNPRIINNLDEYYKNNPRSESTRLLLREGVKSSMTCPLSVEGRPVGLLFRSSREPGAYTKDHVRLHLSIAERLSQAVEKAYRINQLQDAINSYMEMLGFVTHELKSPLASIITIAKTLSQGYFGELNPEHGKIIDRIISKAEYLHNLSMEYLNLSRFENQSMTLKRQETNFIQDIVSPAIELVEPQISEKHIHLETHFPEGPVQIICDPDLMKIVTVNIVGNAVKYGNNGGNVTISIKMTDTVLRVSVRNEGPGFPEEKKKLLFRKFSRIDTPDLMQRKGSGIGLYVSWNIIQLHGGTIQADSAEGEWAEFTYEIPLQLPD
ncbi:MAG TPA: GAF domain-containing sensor histidine kinase [Spirochaetota bacterium]|nr:GAF domain-containing sensor histidine kinase [Spirochaetota bacterium]